MSERGCFAHCVGCGGLGPATERVEPRGVRCSQPERECVIATRKDNHTLSAQREDDGFATVPLKTPTSHSRVCVCGGYLTSGAIHKARDKLLGLATDVRWHGSTWLECDVLNCRRRHGHHGSHRNGVHDGGTVHGRTVMARTGHPYDSSRSRRVSLPLSLPGPKLLTESAVQTATPTLVKLTTF